MLIRASGYRLHVCQLSSGILRRHVVECDPYVDSPRISEWIHPNGYEKGEGGTRRPYRTPAGPPPFPTLSHGRATTHDECDDAMAKYRLGCAVCSTSIDNAIKTPSKRTNPARGGEAGDCVGIPHSTMQTILAYAFSR